MRQPQTVEGKIKSRKITMTTDKRIKGQDPAEFKIKSLKSIESTGLILIRVFERTGFVRISLLIF